LHSNTIIQGFRALLKENDLFAIQNDKINPGIIDSFYKFIQAVFNIEVDTLP